MDRSGGGLRLKDSAKMYEFGNTETDLNSH